MKNVYKSCSILLFACALTGAAAFGETGPNLLRNPSFEGGMRTDVLDSWRGEGDSEFREGAGSYGYTLEANTFPDGDHALKVFSGDADVYQEDLDVDSGTDYLVEAYFYHSSKLDRIDSNETSLRAFIRVKWYNPFEELIREDFTPTHNGTSTADQWVKMTTVFRAPPGAVTASFHIETDINNGGGSIFVDSVFFGANK